MFTKLALELDAYHEKMAQSGELVNSDLVAEVKERLFQLDMTLEKVRSLEAIYSEAHRKLSIAIAGPKARESMDLTGPFNAISDHLELTAKTSGELRLFTEAFYFFAFRIRTIVRHKDKPLPYFGNFEAIGVRDVRNHLIEHPEGYKIYAQSFTFDVPGGPKLKSTSLPAGGSGPVDKGLFINAIEFADNFEKVLAAAVTRV